MDIKVLARKLRHRVQKRLTMTKESLMDMARSGVRGVIVLALCAVAVLLGGCPQNGTGGTVVDVSLAEFSVTPQPASAAAGLVTFRVRNSGAAAHEFLVIKTDLAPDALPTQENGAYEENGAGTELLDEIEEINPGRTANLTLTMEAGTYVLICNIVNQGFVHYTLGMRTAFTVTDVGGQ